MHIEFDEFLFSDIKPKEVTWIWKDRFPRGKLSLIAGSPGLGKSLVTVNMAARISTGDYWPDGPQAPTGKSILFSAEDDPEDTICPRLISAGADLTKIISIQTKRDERGRHHPVSFPSDVELLEKVIKKHDGLQLVVIDPISAYVGALDTHRESNVRAILYPLSILAARYNLAVVVVVHLNKTGLATEQSAINRIMGSIAFVGAARTVWAVVEDRDDIERRFFCCIKNNLAPATNKMLEFMVDTTPTGPCVMWGSTVECSSVDDLFKGGDRLEEAVEFLQDALSDGPVKATEIKDEATFRGISARTLDRAKKVAKVCAKKRAAEGSGKSYWQWDIGEDF